MTKHFSRCWYLSLLDLSQDRHHGWWNRQNINVYMCVLVYNADDNAKIDSNTSLDSKIADGAEILCVRIVTISTLK